MCWAGDATSGLPSPQEIEMAKAAQTARTAFAAVGIALSALAGDGNERATTIQPREARYAAAAAAA